MLSIYFGLNYHYSYPTYLAFLRSFLVFGCEILGKVPTFLLSPNSFPIFFHLLKMFDDHLLQILFYLFVYLGKGKLALLFSVHFVIKTCRAISDISFK